MELINDFSHIEHRFSVKISFSDNGDWQGEIEDLKLGFKGRFSNFLEMVFFLQSCLAEINPLFSSNNFRSWKEEKGSIEEEGERFSRLMREIKALEDE